MPSKNIFINNTCQTADSQTIHFEMPKRVDCTPTPTDGIWAECGQQWNCIYKKCRSNKPFYMPFKKGKKIQFQTLFLDNFNDDKLFPTFGWNVWLKAELVGPNGQVLADVNDFAPRHFVAWNPLGYEYQVLEVDTALFDFPCWSLKVTPFDNEGNALESEAVCSQEFQLTNNCDDLMEIKANHCSADRSNFYYGLPANTGPNGNWAGTEIFEFDNTICLRASARKQPSTTTNLYVQNKMARSVKTKNTEFQIFGLLPPFVVCMLENHYLSGQNLSLDGNIYKNSIYNLLNTQTESDMFKLQAITLSEDEEHETCC